MDLTFITTGGTIDKVYFDEKSRFEVGESVLETVLARAGVTLEYRIIQLMRKDSLEINDDDRALIRATVAGQSCDRFVVTHGTDTMVETAKALRGLDDRTIVLTGALHPARFQESDAVFNVGLAVAAAQTCPPGVYIAMNGHVFHPEGLRKNRKLNRFEQVE